MFYFLGIIINDLLKKIHDVFMFLSTIESFTNIFHISSINIRSYIIYLIFILKFLY